MTEKDTDVEFLVGVALVFDLVAILMVVFWDPVYSFQREMRKLVLSERTLVFQA